MRTLDELGISPAPWEAETFADGHYAYITARSVKGNKKIVGSEHSTADARLIAAAPSLYEALQFINEHISFSALGGGADVVAEAKRMMIDALAAASGESEVAK